jgi:hypothetical protein
MIGQLHTPAALSPGKEPQSRSGRYGEETNLTSAGNRTAAVEPVVCRYTDWTIPIPKLTTDFANLQVFHIPTIHGSRYVDSVANQLNCGLIVCAASEQPEDTSKCLPVSRGSFMV